MRIALVNAPRLLEGIVRNILQEDHALLMIASKDIASRLMPEFKTAGKPEASSSPETRMADAKQEISSLLDGAPASPIVSVKTAGSPAGFEPDFILYYVAEAQDSHPEEDVQLLRKACSFRDVPILILSETARLIQARNLIRPGGSDLLILPLSPEALKSKIDRLMRPVGEKMPVITKLINPFINATLDLMTTMAGMQVIRKDLFLKRNYRLFGDISGIMNFSGKIEGSVVVSFSDELAREIVGRILGLAPETLTSEELRDGVGEIINIISGNAKANLATTEYGHEISLPTVVTGQGHEIRHPNHAPCIVIIFEASGRPFAVEVSMLVSGINSQEAR